MLAEKVRSTNIGVGIGILLEIAGRLLIYRGSLPGGGMGLIAAGLIILVAGVIVFIWGCMNYSEGKGYSKWLGLIGLLSCIGLIVLIFLPDKYKGGGPPIAGGPMSQPPGSWPPPPNTPPGPSA